MTTHDLRIRRISCLAAATLATTLFCLGNVWADDFRTWTDATGKFQIKAKFVALKDGKVTLEKDDGKVVEIDVSKLSAADQKAAKDAAAAAATKEDDPFKPKNVTLLPKQLLRVFCSFLLFKLAIQLHVTFQQAMN